MSYQPSWVFSLEETKRIMFVGLILPKKTYFEPRAVVLNTKISLICRLGIPVEGKINL